MRYVLFKRSADDITIWRHLAVKFGLLQAKYEMVHQLRLAKSALGIVRWYYRWEKGREDGLGLKPFATQDPDYLWGYALGEEQWNPTLRHRRVTADFILSKKEDKSLVALCAKWVA